MPIRASVTPGSTFPDYELPDQDGTPRRLSALQAGNPMAVMLARGGYCPKEHTQHVWMTAMQHELSLSYCTLVTISTDTASQSAEWRQRLGALWPFLSDDGRTVQCDLAIPEYTDRVHDPMVPHTVFLAPDLRVRAVYEGYWYAGRPTAEEMRQQFRAISRECRPDWDILTPELRTRWDAHDHAAFYPYEAGHA